MYRAVNKDFFKKWTFEMAYVLGFFAADGYITVNKRGGQFWCIQITDKELLENIRMTIGSHHKIGSRKRFGNAKTSYSIQIGSIEMCNDLRKLGFTERKTKNLSVNKIPKKYFSHFVRGYFDGDGNVWIGYVHKERKTMLRTIRTVFTSCSRIFLNVLREQLERFDIHKGILSKGKGNYYRLTYSVNNSLKLSDFMYNHDTPVLKGLFLERKRKKFGEFIKMRS